MELVIKEVAASKLKKKNFEDLRFGVNFTDRMFMMEYTKEKGWHNARIEEFHNLSVSPATSVFHYAQEIFEGMKAYSYKGESVSLFRPMDNFERMNTSADRLCMPQIDTKFVFDSLVKLIDLERDWVPKREGTSLYIRPTMIAADPIIKVKSSDTFLFFIILSPVGPYFGKVGQTSKIMVEDEYVRAVRGGMGFAKTGGNYAASIKASTEAAKKGFDQVLWLDGIEQKYVEEVGSMNIFFVIDGVVTTPELNGSILPGITRRSILKIAKELGYKVAERKVSIEEVIEGIGNGKVTEVFGTGTACVVNPVSIVGYKGEELLVSKEPGKHAMSLYNHLVGVQTGLKEDKYGWMTIIK